MLQPGQRVLDLGCGYGRIALPLALDRPVVGLDLSSTLLRAAGARARREGVDVGLVRATMRTLPLASGSVDVVLCLWSAFNELLDREEQLATIREVWRILTVGGWALFEGPRYRLPTVYELASGKRYGGLSGRIRRGEVSGLAVHVYQHDETSLRGLVQTAGVSSSRIYAGPWAGRERQFLYFERMS
jgi:ubiquinone/menaquinone biosynthesis C-methylase UbiE